VVSIGVIPGNGGSCLDALPVVGACGMTNIHSVHRELMCSTSEGFRIVISSFRHCRQDLQSDCGGVL
jgi:hypothetical protein